MIILWGTGFGATSPPYPIGQQTPGTGGPFNTATPVKASLTGLVVNVLLKILLMGSLAQIGLALATAVGAWINLLLVLGFAVLSLILASVGLYGVLSYLMTQRTSEIGVRMALGAQRQEVVRLMLGDGLRPALYGLTLGLVASTATVRLIQSMLYGTRPLDPMIFAGVAGTLLAVAVLACVVPAWRASRINPTQALRME